MATAAELKARLVLEAEARGAGEFEALASELEALAREGGAAAPKFEALAQSLRDVGAQDQLISDFAALRRQAADTADALGTASDKVDQLGRELADASDAARQAAAAQAATAQSLRQAREHQQQLKDAVAQTRAELQAARSAYREGGADSERYARLVAEGADQLKALQAEQLELPVLSLGLPDLFIEHGDPAVLLSRLGLDAPGIERQIRERFLSGTNTVHALKIVGARCDGLK